MSTGTAVKCVVKCEVAPQVVMFRPRDLVGDMLISSAPLLSRGCVTRGCELRVARARGLAGPPIIILCNAVLAQRRGGFELRPARG